MEVSFLLAICVLFGVVAVIFILSAIEEVIDLLKRITDVLEADYCDCDEDDSE